MAGVDAELPADGGDVEDRATASLRDHGLRACLRQVKPCREVQIQDPPPLRLWVLLSRVHRGARSSADRVHDDVDLAEFLDRLFYPPPPLPPPPPLVPPHLTS